MKTKKVPALTIPRLSLYYRSLLYFQEDELVSSKELARLTNCSAAQVRRDLAYFGQFGTPGKGYRVEKLKSRILEILGGNKTWKVALIGVGNLGSALLAYRGFWEQGFHIVAAFEADIRKIGKRFENVVIQDTSELAGTIKQKNIQMAIVTVPGQDAQRVINILTKAGIRAILNFAPVRPGIPSSAELVNIDLSIELEKLAHFLKKKK